MVAEEEGSKWKHSRPLKGLGSELEQVVEPNPKSRGNEMHSGLVAALGSVREFC